MTTLNDILAIHKPKPNHPVLEVIANRFSPRYFSNEPIPLEHLESMFEAARWAPSGHNNQPWHFYYDTKGSHSYSNIFSTLNAYNQSWAKTAPVLILACAIVKNTYGENPFAFYDLGAAVLSLILQAQSIGYYARQMGLFDKEKVKTYLKLDSNYQPFIVIAVGKIGDYSKAPKEIIELEVDPRPRKTDIFTKLT